MTKDTHIQADSKGKILPNSTQTKRHHHQPGSTTSRWMFGDTTSIAGKEHDLSCEATVERDVERGWRSHLFTTYFAADVFRSRSCRATSEPCAGPSRRPGWKWRGRWFRSHQTPLPMELTSNPTHNHVIFVSLCLGGSLRGMTRYDRSLS